MSDLSIEPSLNELLDQRAWLSGLARALVRDPHTADDAVQQTWLQALRRPRLREGRAWLATVLTNVVRQRHRGEARRARREDAVATAHPQAADANERFEVQRAVAAAVQSLAEPFRTTVLLHHFEGSSLADIARGQNVPAGTVRWRLHRAHELLREALAADYGDDRWRTSVLLLCRPPAKAAAVLPVVAALLLAGATAIAWTMAGGEPVAPPPEAPTAAGPAGHGRGGDAGAGDAVRSAAVTADAKVPDASASAPPLRDQHAMVRTHLVSAAGVPLASASLRLSEAKLGRESAPRDLLDRVAPPAFAGADGRIAMALRVPAAVLALLPERPTGDLVCRATFIASAADHEEQKVEVWLADGDHRELGTVVLQPVTTVRGRVLDGDGRALADAAVCVTHPPFPNFCEQLAAAQHALNEELRATTAAGTGTFELSGVRTGLAMVWASKPGYVSAFQLVDLAAPALRVADLVLRAAPAVPPPAVFEIKVRVVDREDRGVANARVDYRAEGPGGQRQAGMSRTRDDGRVKLSLYSFANETAFTAVSIAASDDEARHGPAIVTPTTLDGEEIVLRLPAAEALEVRARTEDGKAVVAFDVSWQADPPAIGEGYARAVAAVATLAAPCTAATLTIRAEGFAQRHVPFVPDATVSPIEVTLAAQHGITGRVTADGRPVAEAWVSLLHCETPVLMNGYRSEGKREGRWDAKTGPDGRFRIDLEQPGTLRLQVRTPGWAPALTARCDFDPGVGWNDVDIELVRGGAIEGRVVDRAGTAQPRAMVAIHDFSGGAVTVLTDRDGVYRCSNLREATYEVRLADRAVDDDSLSVISSSAAGAPRGDCEVRAGETTPFDLVVDRARVAGTLRASGFDPRGWHAQLLRAHDELRTCPRAPIGADGTFTLTSSSTGPHVLLLEAAGGPLGNVTVRMPVDLAAGESALDVPLALAPLRARATAAAGLGTGAPLALVQENGAQHIATSVRIDPTTLVFAAPLAPVGKVVLHAGAAGELGRFVVAPR